MSVADYAHHNEDAAWVWWQEEGQHAGDQEPRVEDPELSWEDGDYYECQDAPDECLSAGNFEQRRDDEAWVCSTCGTGPFTETETGFVYAGS